MKRINDCLEQKKLFLEGIWMKSKNVNGIDKKTKEKIDEKIKEKNKKIKQNGVWYKLKESQKTATVIGVEKERSTLSIMEMVKSANKEYRVTIIGKDAFRLNHNISSIDLPLSIEKINKTAFFFCMNLEDISLGEGLQSIGRGVFKGCGGLRKILIPNSVVDIADDAFDLTIRLEGKSDYFKKFAKGHPNLTCHVLE